jgi:cytochrome b6-f complex iron-sulfur subunit
MNRRQFLILTAAAVFTGCQSMGGGSAAVRGERVVNAGAVTDYAADGLYTRFRDQGFFVIRKGEQLFALSSICTHRTCKLDAESDRSFFCPCHGSTFDPSGKVTEGPARRDLPTLPSVTNENGQLLVTVPIL